MNTMPADAAQFRRRFLGLIALAWTLPPVVGLSFLLFIEMFTAEQMAAILLAPAEPAFIVASLAAALVYFQRYLLPVEGFLRGARQPDQTQSATRRIQQFAWHFWAAFLLYLLIAPFTVIKSAEFYAGFIPQPVDWFRIHLVSLIVSISVGLPIFFLIFDLFGRTLAPLARFRTPHLTIKTKVFLIGALTPLLIDTMLVQYYWTRTGFFDSETFIVWFALEAIAVAGSLIFVRSFSQSLEPLKNLLKQPDSIADSTPAIVSAQSTDELGNLATQYQDLLQQLKEQQELLFVRNELLRSTGSAATAEDTYNIIVDLACKRLHADKTLLFRLDHSTRNLVCFAGTDMLPNLTGHFRLSLDQTSFAEYLFKLRAAAAVSQPENDPRISRQMLERFAVKSVIGAPLIVNNMSAGVLIVINQHMSREYSAFDMAVIDALARESATVLQAQLQQTERGLLELQYRQLNERASVILRSIGDGVISTDARGHVEYLNPVAEQLTGVPMSAALGHPVRQVLVLLDANSRRELDDPVSRCLQDGQSISLPGNLLLLNKETQANSSVEVRVSPVLNGDGTVLGATIVFHNVTELALMSQKLAFQASHDELTGILNRRAFEQRLQTALDHAIANHEQHTFCYLDLDQFKVVNDNAGHLAGDQLLKQLAGYLKTYIRRVDVFARLGGDEFGLLLEGCPPNRAEEIASQLINAINDFSFLWKDNARYSVGVSIGMVSINKDSATITDILSSADAACYVAKQQGRNRYHVFQAGDFILAQHKRDMRWSQLIRQSLADKRFVLYMQPINRISAGRQNLFGEILVRMIDEDGKLVMPNSFIPAAERYHHMSAIDRFVVENAFQFLAAEKRDIRLSINLSAQSLCDNEFLPFVFDQFAATGLDPKMVCFEITESAVMTNLSQAMQFITACRERGCYFALDDFGSGLSSFAYLKNLPVNFLKIDGSFIRDIIDNPVDKAMVEAINNVSHLMKIETVAEYVTNEKISRLMHEMGVDYLQGFHLSKPIPLKSGLGDLLMEEKPSFQTGQAAMS